MKGRKEQKTKYQIPNTNNGITLIALIITIIVMLILVAVTINMAVNGGLFSFAGKATGETQNAINKEQSIADGAIKIGDVYYTIGEYLEQVTENDGNRLKLTYTVTPAEDGLSAVITVNARMLGGLLEGYKEYRIWALQKLEGKTDAEIEQIFVDGQNYWNKVDDYGEPIYANIDELIAYWSENYCDGRFDDVEGMVDDYGYDTLADMAIDWSYVYPQEYEYWDYFDYWAFARKELQGKTDEEIEQIFVDGLNYWTVENEEEHPVFNDTDEWVAYCVEEWPDYYEGCEDIYDVVELEGYDTLTDMAIDWGNVYPEKWAEQEGKLYDNIIHIMDPSGETWWETNTVEYTVERNGMYTFIATNETGTESNSVTVMIDIFGPGVGDYVNYEPTVGTYKVAGGELGSGYGTSDEYQTFTTETGENALKWRILSIDEETGEIEIVSETAAQVSTPLYIRGADGYNHAVDILNDLCETLYSNEKGAKARSINVEDINEKTTYDYTTFSNYGIVYTPSNKQYPNIYANELGSTANGLNGTGLKGSERVEKGGKNAKGVTEYTTYKGSSTANTLKATDTYYYYKPEDYLRADLGINKAPIGLLDVKEKYWLASRCVRASSSYAYFSVRWVTSDGYVAYERNMFTSEGYPMTVYSAVRPVVLLGQDVTLTKGGLACWDVQF